MSSVYAGISAERVGFESSHACIGVGFILTIRATHTRICHILGKRSKHVASKWPEKIRVLGGKQ